MPDRAKAARLARKVPEKGRHLREEFGTLDEAADLMDWPAEDDEPRDERTLVPPEGDKPPAE
jgi:hypothetical protein